MDTTNRLEVSIVLFEEWDRKLINEKNEINPETTDEDYEIFTLSLLGLKSNIGHLIAGMFLTVMNNEIVGKKLTVYNKTVLNETDSSLCSHKEGSGYDDFKW